MEELVHYVQVKQTVSLSTQLNLHLAHRALFSSSKTSQPCKPHQADLIVLGM